MSDRCPSVLEKWIDDDFTDKKSWLFNYKSEAKTCQSQIKVYQDFLTQKKKIDPSLSDPARLGEYFSKKFNVQIHSSYERVLARCISSNREKSYAMLTRFYSVATKLEATNASIIEEISYLDSLLPESREILSGVECATPVLPGLKNKCEGLKKAAMDCDFINSKNKRFDELVQKTQIVIPQIESMFELLQKCIAGVIKRPNAGSQFFSRAEQAEVKEKCDPITAAIEIKRNEVPWVRGDEFQKLAVKKAADPKRGRLSTHYDLSSETLKQAVAQQLTKNRNALAVLFKSNLEDLRCLVDKSANTNCNFEKIRTRLHALPDLRKIQFSTSVVDKEAKMYFEADACMLERHEDRAQTKSTVDGAIDGIAITALTLGAGHAITGIRTVNSASKLGRVHQGLLAGTIAGNAYATGSGLKDAYAQCAEETQTLIEVSNANDLIKENVCADKESALSQAKDTESNCMMTALLTAPSVLPLIGTLPAVKALADSFKKIPKPMISSTGIKDVNQGDRAAKLDEFIKKVKTPGKDNRDLDFASTLTMDERYKIAEAVKGKSLTPAQKKALKEVHDNGGYDFNSNSRLTRQRDEKLQAAGFTKRESAILRGNGIAGKWSQTPKYDKYEFNDLSKPQTQKPSGDGFQESPWAQGTAPSGKGFQEAKPPGGNTNNQGFKQNPWTRSAKRESPNQTSTHNESTKQSTRDAHAAKGTPPPKPESPPAQTAPPSKPKTIFDEAESIVSSGKNRIDYKKDRLEMEAIASFDGKIRSSHDARKAIGALGIDVKDLRKKLQKYNQDQNPDYKDVIKVPNQVLNQIRHYLKNDK